MCSSSSRLTPPSNASRILRVVITAGNATQLSRSRRVPRTVGMGHQRSLASRGASDTVSLPGIMTGQILGGVPLAEAVKSQILVMFRQKNGTPQALSA
jgi:hypothetical protein